MSLADITAETRLGLKIGGALLAVCLVIFLGLRGGSIIKSVLFPAPPTPPEQKFGTLPPIQFPENIGLTKGLSYTINTISGDLPAFSDRIRVFEVIQPEPNLLALQDARNTIQKLGYTSQEIKKSESLYEFSKTNGDSITYDILTKSFSMSSSTVPAASIPIVLRDNLAEYALDTIANIGLSSESIDTTKTKTSFFLYNSGALIPVDKNGDAMVGQVSFFQKDVSATPEEKGLPIYYADTQNGNLFFQLFTDGNNLKTYRAQYNYYTVNTNSSSTYPLKTAQQALEDLKSGNAYIVNNNTNAAIDITEVKLGYYMGPNSPQYLFPIVVFEGVNFIAYVPAIP